MQLPSQLTLVSAFAIAGTTVATVGSNTVTWNGTTTAGSNLSISITALINEGTEGEDISVYGVVYYDSNDDSTNDTTLNTHNPALEGTSEPTVFTVAAAAQVAMTPPTATMSVATSDIHSSVLIYTVALTNNDSATMGDNPGHEFVLTLPSELTLASATVNSGTVDTDLDANLITWNGSIAAAASVTMTIVASINNPAEAQSISAQGTLNYDEDGNGTNEVSMLTDNTATIGADDVTVFVVGADGDATDISFEDLDDETLAALQSGQSCSALGSNAMAEILAGVLVGTLLMRRRRISLQ